MGLEQQLEEDLKASMRQKDAVRRDVLRLARNAISYATMTKGQPLDEQEIIVALQKEVRQRKESIEAYTSGGRNDLANREIAELAILTEYVPRQKNREEIAEIATSVIAEVNATGPAQKGQVMKKLMPILKGQAEGNLVNQVVSDLLEG